PRERGAILALTGIGPLDRMESEVSYGTTQCRCCCVGRRPATRRPSRGDDRTTVRRQDRRAGPGRASRLPTGPAAAQPHGARSSPARWSAQTAALSPGRRGFLIVESFWDRVEERGLRQGDYLPGCSIPVFGSSFTATDDPQEVRADCGDLIVVTQSCD